MHLGISKAIAILAIALTCFASTACFAQDSVDVSNDVVSGDQDVVKIEKVNLDEEGKLKGFVFVLKDDEKTPVNAKVSLTTAGLIVDSVEADESGVFSFPNVEPGSYEMFATAENMISANAVEVMPFTEGSPAVYNMEMSYTQPMETYAQPMAVQSYETVYDSYGAAPVQSFTDYGSSYGSSGGGGYVGGGRVLNRRRVALLGLFGLLAIGDSSPDGPN